MAASSIPPEVVQALLERERLALVGRLLPGVVHNLSGAMQIIRLPVDLIEILLAKGDQAGAINKISSLQDGLGRLQEEIDLLANKCPYPDQEQSRSLNLAEMARQELAFWRADMFYKHELEINSDLPAGLSRVLCPYLDAALAFNCLVANALEALAQAGQHLLQVRGRQGKGRVELLISDSGPGPGPEVAETMFEPFVTTKAAPHQGLGLFLARRALEAWGGQVRWQQDQPAGFVMDLPAAE